jgi:AhpD family alkylhydroperoxidase
MEAKLRELISLGASVSAHCFPCLDYHLEQARKLGLNDEEIQEAIRVGFMIMNGAGDKMWEKIKDIFPGLSVKKSETCSDNQRIMKNRHASAVRF